MWDRRILKRSRGAALGPIGEQEADGVFLMFDRGRFAANGIEVAGGHVVEGELRPEGCRVVEVVAKLPEAAADPFQVGSFQERRICFPPTLKSA